MYPCVVFWVQDLQVLAKSEQRPDVLASVATSLGKLNAKADATINAVFRAQLEACLPELTRDQLPQVGAGADLKGARLVDQSHKKYSLSNSSYLNVRTLSQMLHVERFNDL